MPPDVYSIRIYELPCTECGKVSRKSFIELETKDRLPCDHCCIPIEVANYYTRAKLQEIIEGLGRHGAILRERKKGD